MPSRRPIPRHPDAACFEASPTPIVVALVTINGGRILRAGCFYDCVPTPLEIPGACAFPVLAGRDGGRTWAASPSEVAPANEAARALFSNLPDNRSDA